MAAEKLSLIYREFVGFERALNRQTRAFEFAHPDSQTHLEAYDVPALYEKMVTQKTVLTSDYDLFLSVTDWMPELMRDKAVVCLDEYLRDNPPVDWPQGWSDTVLRLQTDREGRVYGIPYHDGPEVFMYRKDLFNDPKQQELFYRQYGRKLDIPQTWAEFADLARFFTRPDEDLYGCVVAAKPDGHNNVYDFMIHLCSRGGMLLDENMRPAFSGAEGKSALQFYLRLLYELKVTQPDPLEYESVRAGEFYASGRAAMMWNWCGFQTIADMPDFSKIPGQTGSTMLPGGDGPRGKRVSFLVYWVMTIPTGSRNKDLAWQMMQHLATPAMDRITAEEGASATRLSTWNDLAIRRSFPYYEIIEDVHRYVESPPPIPEYPQINEVLNRMMEAATRKGAPVDQVLREAAQETEAILAGAGYYR